RPALWRRSNLPRSAATGAEEQFQGGHPCRSATERMWTSLRLLCCATFICLLAAAVSGVAIRGGPAVGGESAGNCKPGPLRAQATVVAQHQAGKTGRRAAHAPFLSPIRGDGVEQMVVGVDIDCAVVGHYRAAVEIVVGGVSALGFVSPLRSTLFIEGKEEARREIDRAVCSHRDAAVNDSRTGIKAPELVTLGIESEGVARRHVDDDGAVWGDDDLAHLRQNRGIPELLSLSGDGDDFRSRSHTGVCINGAVGTDGRRDRVPIEAAGGKGPAHLAGGVD